MNQFLILVNITANSDWVPGHLLTKYCRPPITVRLAPLLAFTQVLVCKVFLVRKYQSEQCACCIIGGVDTRRQLKTFSSYLNPRDKRRGSFCRRCGFEPSQHSNPAVASFSVNSVVVIRGPKDGPLHVL
jgi:hypothetical protein